MGMLTVQRGIMEVTVYTRHSKGCRIKDRLSKCPCNKWLSYRRGGMQVRESAKTRSWETAVKLARKMEREYEDRRLGIAPTPSVTATTVEDAVAAYLAKISDPKQSRKASTLRKPQRMTSLLLEFCDRHNLTYLSELTPMLLEEWRTSWTFDPRGQSLRIHDMVARAFFRWAHRMDMLPRDPYEKLDRYKARNNPQTMPLSREEVDRLLAAIPFTNLSEEDKMHARRLMRLQRWSGLSISDAVTLRADALLSDDSLVLRRTKTGVSVTTELPHDVADELRMHHRSPGYFFWDTNVKKESAISEAQNWYRAIFDTAGVSRSREKGGLPSSHRFRDTYAVEFLLAGGSYEDLSQLLGNTIAVCEKHYSAFTPARKERLTKVARESYTKQRAAKDGEATIIQ